MKTRPIPLENCCLADVVAKYSRKIDNHSKTKTFKNNLDESEDDDSNDPAIPTELYHLQNGYKLVKRKTSVCIRYVKYHHANDKENHFREILMLFHPWRSEEELIGDHST